MTKPESIPTPLMAIVSKIPTEILSEIFYLLCKSPIFVYELNNSCCREDFPWAVGMVCRRWRSTFLSYPPIWASLTLSDSNYDTYKIAEPETRISFGNEVIRRLALYLERSAMYPLNLDVFLWTNHNVSTTMMALKMLSGSSERWRTVKFELLFGWQADCLLACKGKWPILERLEIRALSIHKHIRDVFEVAPQLTYACVKRWTIKSGWILPWAQLTEVWLTLHGGYALCDVPTMLPMLHNVRELRIRINDNLDYEGDYPQFGPILLNQLRVLEVPHPAVLSWLDTPSLCDLYFADYQEYEDGPFDVHKQMSSFMQRSGCKIRKLSFESGRRFYVGTLNGVEELEINYQHTESGIRYPPIDISSLPNLRYLTIICNLDEDIKTLPKSLTAALKSAKVPARNERSTDASISKLERLAVKLLYYNEQPKIPKSLQKIADKWPLIIFLTERS